MDGSLRVNQRKKTMCKSQKVLSQQTEIKDNIKNLTF